MRDKRFVAEHRGGVLTKQQHHQLIIWACNCAEHVVPLLSKRADCRLITALKVAKDWKQGSATVGDARKAAVAAHTVARESQNPTAVAVARSVGHAVATAHMADHALGAAWYALKAVKNADKPVDVERKWQDNQLPLEIRELVISTRIRKHI
jgi:hypothetical protein